MTQWSWQCQIGLFPWRTTVLVAPRHSLLSAKANSEDVVLHEPTNNINKIIIDYRLTTIIPGTLFGKSMRPLCT